MFVSLASQRTQRRGFSLVEVLTAMFVIVVGLSGVTATLWWGTRQTDNGKVITEASNLARICMESLINRGSFKNAPANVNDAPSVRNPVSAPPLALIDFSTVGVTEAGDDHNIASQIHRFTRNISLVKLSNTPTSYDYALCRATVQIYWRDKNNMERSVLHETITPWTDPPAGGVGGSGP